MELDALRSAVRADSSPDNSLLSAIDRGALLHAQADNPPSSATHVWPRRVRHLAKLGCLIDDPETVARDLSDLAAAGTPFTVVIYRLPTDSGEEVYTAMLTGEPARVRVAFAHQRSAAADSVVLNPTG